MMELILWRHVEAHDGFPDHERALTKKGLKDAEKMAHWLNQHLPENTRILVSPALRAQQTAAQLKRPFETCSLIAPGASGADLLQAAVWGNSQDCVLLVGHQPALGMAASLAMTRKANYWCVKKGSIWWLANRMRTEDQETVVKAVLVPELL